MITLGLNAVSGGSAAALVHDGVLLAAAEEERFTRIAQARLALPLAAWNLPFHAAAWCLEHAGLTLGAVDHVAFGFDPGQAARGPTARALGDKRETLDALLQPLLAACMANAPQLFVHGAPAHLRGRFEGGTDARMPQWHVLDRARCHQASAFLAAPFDRCAVLMLGDHAGRAGMCCGVYRDNRFYPLGQVEALSSLESVYEQVLRLAQWLRETSGEKTLVLAGELARDALLKTRLREEGPFEAVWVQACVGGAAAALGAALWSDAVERLDPSDAAEADHSVQPLAPRSWQMQPMTLGPQWDDEAIGALLRRVKLPHERVPDDAELAERAAGWLAEGAIVGWFQGRMAFGPLSLGTRSILASPLESAMRARLDDLTDHDEDSPLAAAVAQESFADWFTPAGTSGAWSAFMLHRVLPRQAARIASATRGDGRAQVQPVDADTQPRLHALLGAFEQRTGVPVLIDTSFKLRGRPVVCSPDDALEAFYRMPLDVLVIGSFVLRKTAAPA